MTRYLLEEKFRQIESGGASGFLRVTATHKVDLFVGVEDGRRVLLLLCDDEPPAMPSFETIACSCRKREDGRWAVLVFLERSDLSSLFAYLAEDLAFATEGDGDSRRAAGRLSERLSWWQQLLSRGRSGMLGSAELRGLVGELLFLRDSAIPTLGIKSAVDGWVGPFEAPRDFRFADRDVEVKALTRDAKALRISSIGQLEEAGVPIFLCRVTLEYSTADQEGAFSVHDLVESVHRKCETEANVLTALKQRLWAAGYVDLNEYRDIHFLSRGLEYFACTADFPKLTSGNVPEGIVGASYDIDLATIRAHEVQSWNVGSP